MPDPRPLPSSVVSRSSTHEMQGVQSSSVSPTESVYGTGLRYRPGLVAGRGARMTESSATVSSLALEDRVRALLERGARDGAATLAIDSVAPDILAYLRTRLDEDELELLTLRIDRELEWEEIAAILEVNAVTLRKRWERLVRKLEQMARKAGLLE